MKNVIVGWPVEQTGTIEAYHKRSSKGLGATFPAAGQGFGESAILTQIGLQLHCFRVSSRKK